jgi:tetratricopeptide (TPR) repeat protein
MTNTNSTDKRPRLSVAMIVRDAAKELADTLESIGAIADEIVVADTGSTDGTLEMARRAADIMLEIEWRDNFAAVRNECLRRVTGDWVLWLEPGETFDESAAQQLRKFVDEAADTSKAYMLFLQRPALNAANSCEQIGQLRLIPNQPGLKFTGRIREQILSSVRQAGLGLDALDCVLRQSAIHGDARRMRTLARNKLNMANLAVTEEGEEPRSLLSRAEALAELGRAAEAGAVYRHAIKASENGSSEMLEAFYGLLTSMDADPDAADAQMKTCLEALAVFPLDAQLLCGMGSYLLRAGRLDLAARSYETATLHGKVDPSIWHLADLADVTVVCWSLALQLLGDSAAAEKTLIEALADRPDSVRMRRQLIEMLVKAGREREALAQCKMLPDDLPFRAMLPDVIRGAVLAAAKKSAAALVPLRAAYKDGCRDPLCLRWLASAQLALQNLAEVDAITSEWERCEPGSLEIKAIRRSIEQLRPPASGIAPPKPGERRIDAPSQLGLPIGVSAVDAHPSLHTR